MKLADLLAVDYRDAIRGRHHGLVPAPRPPFDIGVGDGVALVEGADVRRGYVWRGDEIAAIDRHDAVRGREDQRVVAKLARTGRAAIDARAFVDAILADCARGPWLVLAFEGKRVYQRLASPVIAGRGFEVQLQIPVRTVARHHSRFAQEGTRWYVEDLGSGNGTWIGGKRIARAELADGDVVSVAGHDVTFRMSIVPALRAIDPGDDAAWSQLYLDRIELGFLEHDPPAYGAEPPTRPVAVRAGSVRWAGFRDLTGTDTRWLFADRDDAEVFTDVLLGGERDELPAPIVGDLCACFRAGDGVDAIVRLDRLVARVALSDASRDLDALAARIVARAVK